MELIVLMIERKEDFEVTLETNAARVAGNDLPICKNAMNKVDLPDILTAKEMKETNTVEATIGEERDRRIITTTTARIVEGIDHLGLIEDLWIPETVSTQRILGNVLRRDDLQGTAHEGHRKTAMIPMMMIIVIDGAPQDTVKMISESIHLHTTTTTEEDRVRHNGIATVIG